MAYSPSSSPLARASDNRFARITTTDQGATLWVVTLLSMIYAILVLAVRLGFTKWRAHTWDDFVVVVAHLLAFSMWAFLFSALKSGLGKSYSILEDAEISKTQELYYTSCILLYIALAFSKVSILMLIRSVFARNVKVSILAIGTGVVVVVLGLIGAIATTTECSVDTVIPKPGDEYCVDLIPWLKAITVGDMITEVIIMALPIIGFHSSLMSIKSKFIVVMAFFTRIPNVVFALMHFLAYAKFVESRESAIRIVPTVAWQSVLLSFNLISATTPLLKGFTQGFMTQGVSLGYLREGTTGGGSGMSGGSYELKSLTKSTRSKSKFSSLKLTPSDAYATTTVEGNSEEDTLPPSRLDRLRGQESSRKSTLPPSRMDCMRGQRAERSSIASQESQKIMIKQEWQISAA